jgi:hypothetical protein
MNRLYGLATFANVRCGSRAVKLRVSRCFPVCLRKETVAAPSSLTFREQRRQHGAPLFGQREARGPSVALDKAADHHVLLRGVRDAGLLPIGVRRETEEQQASGTVSSAAIDSAVGLGMPDTRLTRLGSVQSRKWHV